jgi:hypothetical protein
VSFDAFARSTVVTAAMAAAESVTGMEVVFLGRHTEESSTFARVHGGDDWPEVVEGASAPRTDTLCARLLDGVPSATSDAAHDPAFRDAAMTADLGVCSYVGVPVRDASGTVVATLCGMDRRAVEVDTRTIAVLQGLADVLAAHLGTFAADVVIRRAGDGWEAVVPTAGGEPDDTAGLVLAALLAEEAGAPIEGGDEVERLRASVGALERSLQARVTVEQAIGILVERQHRTPQECFARLQRSARAHGRRLAELSADVVLSTRSPVPLPLELSAAR